MLKLSSSFQQQRSLQDYVGVTNATVYQLLNFTLYNIILLCNYVAQYVYSYTLVCVIIQLTNSCAGAVKIHLDIATELAI